MKLQFKNYNLKLDKVEKKFLIQYCKQTLNQLPQKQEYAQVFRIFDSILNKLNSAAPDEEIKLTKDEFTKFEYTLKENLKHLKIDLKKAGFFKRFFLKPVIKQYEGIIQKHFK
ncbi:MAG TPA: hypothetical protein PK887_07145 [Ignavibacteriales bacterium]|jgi:hypothetical protein|nr:hypothetical protein [Ignavibacteriales bacterium]